MGYKTDTESCTGNLLKVFYSFWLYYHLLIKSYSINYYVKIVPMIQLYDIKYEIAKLVNFIVSHVVRLKTIIKCFLNRFNAYFWRSIDRILETKQKFRHMYQAFLMPEITIIWHKKKIDNIKQDTMSENTFHNWWKILQ